VSHCGSFAAPSPTFRLPGSQGKCRSSWTPSGSTIWKASVARAWTSLGKKDLLPAVLDALASAQLSADRLELEITEAVLMLNSEVTLRVLHQLRALGIRVSMDDFGTGYSSLSYLRSFAFDKIKIDRCFIDDIAEPGGSSCIVQAVVNIAAARHMTATAEGVETKQQLELLRALGCAEMQGYLFSHAKPAAEIKQLLFSHQHQSAAVA
jgi:EAL domain-containing protein (putative c-di-GMP-specific phosphodiesterase class I)